MVDDKNRIDVTEFVRIQTAARAVKMHQGSLRYAITRQLLPYRTTGDGLLLVRIKDVERFLKTGKFRGKSMANAGK